MYSIQYTLYIPAFHACFFGETPQCPAISIRPVQPPYLGSPSPSRSHQGSKGRSWGPLLSLSKKDDTNMIGKAARGLVSPTCPTPHTGTNSSRIGLQAYSMKVHHPAGMICPWKPICTWLFSVANWFGVSSACMQILLWVGEERMLSPSCFPEQFWSILRHQRAIHSNLFMDVLHSISKAFPLQAESANTSLARLVPGTKRQKASFQVCFEASGSFILQHVTNDKRLHTCHTSWKE